jgi:SDR family mycofactocin-dependent oxidoreductase
MGRLDGKVALITGAARGQGRGHAIRFAEEGADILAVDICKSIGAVPYPLGTPEELQETAAAVEALGRRVVTHEVDVRDSAAMKQAIDDGAAELGKLDVVIANAGIWTIQPWHDVTPDVWSVTLDINLAGVWHTCQHAAPHLIKAGGGSIIITSSTAGLKGLPFLVPYAASKHGVVGIMRVLTNELAQHSIRVNTIHPSGVETPGGVSGAMEKLIAESPQLGPIFMPALPVPTTYPIDIANAALFLASDEGRYVTGMELKVDAGTTAR